MPFLPEMSGNSDRIPSNILDEIQGRFDEISQLDRDQMQMGTQVPQLYGSLARYIANPSTVSVETFRRMVDTDETLGAGLDFLKLALLGRFGEYKHPSKEITEFVKRCLNNMETPWGTCLMDMFSAEEMGFYVGEKVWQYDENFGGMPAYRPKKIVGYPQLTIVFSVDMHGELLPEGIHQYQRYHNSFMHSAFPYGGLLANDLNGFRPDLYASVGDFPYPIRVAADLAYMTMRMPRHKCIHLTSSVSGAMGNPYGKSRLRRAYKSWVSKDATLKMWLVAADRKGTPLVIAYADPHLTVEGQTEGNQAGGNINGQQGSLIDMVAAALKNVHNSSFVVMPGKKGEAVEVDSVDVTGDLNVFKDAVGYHNQAMMRSLLIPPLVMGGDGGGSFALGQEHHKIFGRSVDGMLKVYKPNILQQLIQPMIAYNFPRSAWQKDGLGEFVLEEYDIEAMEKLANVYGSLVTSGFMTPEDQVDMDEVRKRIPMAPKPAKAPVVALPGFGGEDDPEGAGKDADPNAPAAGSEHKDQAGEEQHLPGQASPAEEEEQEEAEHPPQF